MGTNRGHGKVVVGSREGGLEFPERSGRLDLGLIALRERRIEGHVLGSANSYCQPGLSHTVYLFKGRNDMCSPLHSRHLCCYY